MPFIVIFCVYEYAPTQPLMDAGVAWRIAGTLGACWFCNAVVLALVTKRDKWWTFWDPKTGAQDLIDRYREVIVNANDSFLPELFENNKRMWWPIRDEIKDHIQASWERWEDDCPEWWTEEFKASLDEDLLPDGLRVARGATEVPQRKRSVMDLPVLAMRQNRTQGVGGGARRGSAMERRGSAMLDRAARERRRSSAISRVGAAGRRRSSAMPSRGGGGGGGGGRSSSSPGWGGAAGEELMMGGVTGVGVDE